MKKIAFFVQWMLSGGVENALISLSNKLVDMGNEVSIYVIEDKGDFIKKVPNTVKLLKIPMEEKIRKTIPVGGTKVTVRDCLDKKEYIKALKFVAKHKLNKRQFAELNIDLNKIPELDKQYDIAVNFHMHSPFLVWYLSERVKANKKYTWIHNDFSTTRYNIILLKKYLNCVDHFFAVSKKLKQEFIEAIPEYASKTEVALNIVPIEEIIQKSNEFYPKEYKNIDCLKILTVGRLEEQKGYDLAIEACKKLKDDGYKFKWYVLGDGTLKKELEHSILDKEIDDCFYLLGSKMNPYPYFKNCDIYVQTSRHEGYVTTVTEAKIFNKPIITTDVSGAREQIKNDVNGYIVNINANCIYEKLKMLLDNEDKRLDLTKELKSNPIEFNYKWLSMFEEKQSEKSFS